MTYDVIALACEKLSYRDKLRLAQLLIQVARKEEENANPQNRSESEVTTTSSKIAKTQAADEIDTIGYVVDKAFEIETEQEKDVSQFNKINVSIPGRHFRGGYRHYYP